MAYAYDYDDRLVSLTDATNTYSYKYSGMKDRIATVSSSGEERYVLDVNRGLPEVLCRTNSSGTVTDYFVYGAAGLVSKIGSDDSVYYYHFDPTGNTIAMTDINQNMVNKYAYTPYGSVTKEGSVSNPFQYSGQFGVMADNSGLYFMRARFYHPDMMRFISLDKKWGEVGNPQSLNLYAYVQGNRLWGWILVGIRYLLVLFQL
ncbi:MAG: hypothetical protein HQK77_19370 [Desulfobacterales bacterium]|nr:hypothetical protein [Desulfobacterales bacterium]